MGKFKYTGVTAEGRRVQSEIEANSIVDAKKTLRRQRIRVTKIAAPSITEMDLGELLGDLGFGGGYGQAELMRFTRQLSILINAGVPILECLELLYKQELNITLKRELKSIHALVEEGKTLYEAMKVQKGFTKLYCSLVKAGEQAGILDIVLNKLAEYLEKQQKLKKQVKSALTYPVIVIFVGIIVIFGLMVFVVPQFVGMLKETAQEIPWPTQVVMDTSQFFQDYVLFLIGGVVVFFYVFLTYIKTKEGKKQWDIITMKLPLFGMLIIKGNLGSFTRTLATMLSAGVPIIDALETCIDTLDNTKIAKDLTKVRQSVVEGKSITQPLSRIEYFPPLVNQMMKVGESTGNLDNMLVKVADVFETEVEELVQNLTKLIEPFILVFLGGMIGFVLIAMYLPIFMSAGGADS